MEPSLTDALCTQCGLCCDGSLFADVELSGRAEVTRMEVLGLAIDDDEHQGLMSLPCRALRGTRCSIYPHRPKCCRTFECALLQRARRGDVSVERAQRHIADALVRIGGVKTLMVELGCRDQRLTLEERYAEALAKPAGANPETHRKRQELEAAMSDVRKSIRTTFLGEAGKR